MAAILYAGGTYLFDRDPSDLKPWVAQAGIELQSPWRIWGDSTRLIAGDEDDGFLLMSQQLNSS